MSENNEKLYWIVDLLCSEYGWSIEYCLKLPSDIILNLVKALNKRKQENFKLSTKLMAIAISSSFSGKLDKIDGIFKNSEEEKAEINPDIWKSQVKKLWLNTKTNGGSLNSEDYKKFNDEFEEKWKSGNVQF
jgi:hypothetical protein